MAREFLTVPEELMEHAAAAADYFGSRGYRLRYEHREIGFPYLPALCCRRSPTTVLVEIADSLTASRAREWSGYCRSTAKDTRIAFVIPSTCHQTAELLKEFREMGVGVYVSDGRDVTEVMGPVDIGLQLSLPPLESLSRPARVLLGPAYEKVDRGDWREAFEDLCQVLETEARKYFAHRVAVERMIVLRKNGQPLAKTPEQIEKLPMGALAETFSRIQTPNHADSIVVHVLQQINQDLIGVKHYKTSAATERRLRKNVGVNSWRVVAALRAIL